MASLRYAPGAGNRHLVLESLEYRHLLSVDSFTLVNAATDQDLFTLSNGQTIDLAQLPTQKLNIRANTSGSVESVVFDLNGQSNFRTENSAPYSLFGDQNGDYRSWTPELQTYTLNATSFALAKGKGTNLGSQQIVFTFSEGGQPPDPPPPVGPAVTSFTLINADTDQPIGTIANGQTINLANLATTQLNIRADTQDTIGSVRFGYDGQSNYRTESGAPYSLFGDRNGDYKAGTLSLGSHSLTATPYSGPKASGTAGTGLTIAFNVIDDSGPPPSGSQITGFTLIDAQRDQPIGTVSEGMDVDLWQLPTTGVNLRADTSGSVGSVVFAYNGTNNFKTDNSGPFALFGESGGNYDGELLEIGKQVVVARAYSGDNGTGSLLDEETLNFQVIIGHSIPDQIHLSWTGDPAHSFTAVWRTFDTSTPSQVQYRQLGNSTWQTATGSQKSSGTTGTLHQATVTGLQPDTEYEYRVRGDNGNWSTPSVMQTAPTGTGGFDFVFFADTGLVGRTDGLASGTEQIINDIAALEPLLVLGGGDYAYYNTDQRFGPLETHIDAWFNQSAPFLTESLFMPTLGNHETRLGESYDAWIDRMALPSTQTDNFEVYSFDVGQVHFVSILADRGSAALPQSQVNWIINDVQAAQARGQTWIIPYMHVSAFADGASHPSNVNLRNQLGPVFEDLGIHLVLSAHDQNYERTFPLSGVGDGNPVVTDHKLTGYDEQDGIVWLKVSPAGKLSNKGNGFSEFQTNPPPYWTATRDDTLHHFARFQVATDGTLTTQIYATPGDGTPSFLFDTFTYRLGGAALNTSNAVEEAFAELGTG